MAPKKLLFVDDEPDLPLLIEQQFEGKLAEFEVELVFAENGVQALERLEEHKDIEVVLTDINMPIMDGLEFLGKATKLDRLLKIVVVSAYSDMSNIRKAMNRGAYDFITKPIDFEDCTETIARTLRKIEQIKTEMAELSRLKEIEKEMEMARKIQTSILPSSFTPFLQNKSFEIFGTMIPARVVSGNFYDFFPIGAEKLALVVGETTTQGMPAAIFISTVREAVRSFANKSQSVAGCTALLNNFVYYLKKDDITNFSLFFGIYNLTTGEIEYFSSGLPPATLLAADSTKCKAVNDESLSLGSALDSAMSPQKMTLKNDDTLIIHTKGIIQATNSEMVPYSHTRLDSLLSAHRDKRLTELVDLVILDVRSYITPKEQSNDYVILCLKSKI